MTGRRTLIAALAGLALVVGLPLATPATAAPATPAAIARLGDPDPGVLGPEPVDELAYDLGATAFTPEGFDAPVELRAQVFAPHEITGSAPLVILLHGRHITCIGTEDEWRLEWPCSPGFNEIPSYKGYGTLGHLLASRGMIVASIGANGVNAADDFVDDGGASARAQLVLEHLRRWRAWNASPSGSPFGTRFVGHVDLDRVGLMGHSRGGEGVVAAAQLNAGTGHPFGIRAVFALAPVDFARRVLGGVPLGVLLPMCDGDVSDLQGASYYDDSRYAYPGDPAAKDTYLLHGANHNFFNSVWTSGPGSSDDAGFGPIITDGREDPAPCQPGGSARITAAVQDQTGATIMAAFLRRHLDDDPSLDPIVTGVGSRPASTAPASWTTAHHAPDRLDVARWDDPATFGRNRFGLLATQVGVTLPRLCTGNSDHGDVRPVGQKVRLGCATDRGLAVANDTGALDVGWLRPGAVVREPVSATGRDVTGYDGLRLRVAVPQDVRNDIRVLQDLSVVIEDADGHRASVPLTGSAALRRLDGGLAHAVLNGVRVPLTAFTGIDLSRVRAVELRFDRTPRGRLLVNDLAFTVEGTGPATTPPATQPTRVPEDRTCRATYAARWACAVAQAVWGREPDFEQLPYLTASYRSAAARRAAVRQIVDTDAARFAQGQTFVERYAQVDVGMDWYGEVVADAHASSWEALQARLVGGFGYRSPATSSSGAMVDSAYRTITGRLPSAADRAHWVGVLDATGTDSLIASLIASTPARRLVLEDRYQQLTGHGPDAGGRAYWMARLGRPGGEAALVAALLGTESFRAAAIA